jgi:SAM-dependent methyltransferase
MITDMNMEEVDCPLCKEPKNILLHREDPFRMVKCSSCQFIYLNPRPTNESILHFYQHYLPEDSSSIQSWKRMMAPVFHRAANLLSQHRKKGRLLDVGTGFGFFMEGMRKNGWKVTGVEISQKAIEYARNGLGLTVHSGPLEKAEFPNQYFDVVTAFYVIEHLRDPVTFLKECHRILKPGGVLLLRYPHTTPIKNLLHLFRIPNRLYDLPAHLSDFSPGIIQRCLESVGFERCLHMIGGYTLPPGLAKRIASSCFGNLSEILFYLSLKTFLFPGVSKTILATK